MKTKEQKNKETEEHKNERTKKRHKPKAITLVEILVVLGIVALMSSMSAVFLKSQKPNIELHYAAQELRATLLEARARALTDQRPYQVHFTAGLNQYELKEVASSTERVIQLPKAVRYDQVGPWPDDTVIFNSAGAAGPPGTVRLLNQNGKKKDIIINPSGYIKVE